MKVLITGATNLVGQYVLEELLKTTVTSNELFLLLNPKSTKNESINNPKLNKIYCDLDQSSSIAKHIEAINPRVILHLAQMQFSGSIIRAMSMTSTNAKIIAIGSTKIYSNILSKRILYEINENLIKESGYQYLILRPTMIYGSQQDRNIHKLINRIKQSKIIPLINKGLVKYQPIHINDVARIILAILREQQLDNRIIDIAGLEVYTTAEIVNICADALSLPAKTIKININLLIALLKIFKKNTRIKQFYDTLNEIKRNKDIADNNYCEQLEGMVNLKKGIHDLVKHMK